MKKIYILTFIVAAVALQNCSTTKQAQVQKPAAVTYASNIQGILSNNCAPCHFPPQGNKEPLNTYATAKAHIDEIIDRINRNPGEKGFMPAKHPKLADSTITAFVKWKEGGLLEK